MLTCRVVVCWLDRVGPSVPPRTPELPGSRGAFFPLDSLDLDLLHDDARRHRSGTGTQLYASTNQLYASTPDHRQYLGPGGAYIPH